MSHKKVLLSYIKSFQKPYALSKSKQTPKESHDFYICSYHFTLHENNIPSNHPILSILRLFRVNRAICNSYVFEFVIHYGDKAVQKTPLSNCQIVLLLLRCSDLNAKQQPCLNFKAQRVVSDFRNEFSGGCRPTVL